jgi:hypothetical protein
MCAVQDWLFPDPLTSPFHYICWQRRMLDLMPRIDLSQTGSLQAPNGQPNGDAGEYIPHSPPILQLVLGLELSGHLLTAF